jgi:hypothetical protein
MPVNDEAARRRAIRAQRAVLWLSKTWLWLATGFFALFVGLPFLAPTLMHLGAEGPARVIYAMLRPVPPVRSFDLVLFGEQAPIPEPLPGGWAASYETYAPGPVLPGRARI